MADKTMAEGSTVPQPQALSPKANNPKANNPGPEEVNSDWQGFDDKTVRRRFIRKVYLILMCQLLFSTLVVACTMLIKEVHEFVRRNPWFFLAAYITFIVVYIALVCCQSVRRRWPLNFIFLIIFTCAFAYVMAAISIRYRPESVLMALGICTACCLAISLFSFNTRYDFTSWMGAVFILSIIVLVVGIISLFTMRSFPLLNRIYAGLAALLFMIYLAIDTQMLLGNKKYSLSPEEYIFASVQLYMDIVNLFLLLLNLFGDTK